MSKYRALTDIAPTIKTGDIVSFEDELNPAWASKFVAAGDDEDETNSVVSQELDGNISREDLKAKADELGIDYASNIGTAKLLDLVKAKMAEDAAGDDGGE